MTVEYTSLDCITSKVSASLRSFFEFLLTIAGNFPMHCIFLYNVYPYDIPGLLDFKLLV